MLSLLSDLAERTRRLKSRPRQRATSVVKRLAVASIGAVMLAGCGHGRVDSARLSGNDESAAQAALNALRGSNISRLLVSLSFRAGLPPAVCRVHLESSNPLTLKVYVFWIPFIVAETYSWLSMTVTKNVSRDTFHLGAAAVVPPQGGPSPVYNTPLSAYGKRLDRLSGRVLLAHAGDVFSKPGASCQVLTNGSLRLVPST
jgi:hypothetical protein